MNDEPEEISIPLVSEEVYPGTRQVVTGGVRVTRRPVPHEEIVQQELHHDQVEVRRVQVNRQVDGPQDPRQEGDTLIVPVMEEVLQVQRVWILKEEVHVRRTTTVETHEEKVVVSREEADVQRIDSSGNAIATASEPASKSAEPPLADAASERNARFKPTSILERTEQERERGTRGERSILERASSRPKQ